MSRPSICVKVVGSLNWDIINQVESHYSDWQHAPFQNASSMKPGPGGHGVNQATAVYRASHRDPSNSSNQPVDKTDTTDFGKATNKLAHTGLFGQDLPGDIQVYLIGMIGTEGDGRRQKIKDALAGSGVHVEGVKQAANIGTGYTHVDVDIQGTPRIKNNPQANGHLTWNVVQQELESGPHADLILVQLEIPQDTVVSTIQYANKNRIPVVFNAAPISDQGSSLYNHDQIFHVDHLILNHHCVDAIWRTKAQKNQNVLDDGMTSVPQIQARYSRCVVITLGHRGVLTSYLGPADATGERGQYTFFYSAKKAEHEPKDETGASDAFIGVYAVEILRQMKTTPNSDLAPGTFALDIGAAIEHGIRAGALTTRSFGSFPAIPWREEWVGADKQWLTANSFVYMQ